MKTLIIIGIVLGIGIILIASLSTLSEIRKEECKEDGGVMTGPFGCVTSHADYSEPDIIEKTIERYKDMPEVKAFYAKYQDASVSVRDDHVSYVTGNDDGFKVRMNLYFDENYELDYFTLRCYVDRELQNDVAETFIQKYLQEFECEKRPVSDNELQKNLTLYVSNQSFENSPVDITVMIDGKVLVDRDFDVGNQHVYIDYHFMLTPGTHTIFAKSATGEAELEKEFEIDEQKWAVLSYWFYPDDPHYESPHFEFDEFDTPVGFA